MRHFPQADYTELNALINRIADGDGDRDAINAFYIKIDAWTKARATHIAGQVFAGEVHESWVMDGLQEMLLHVSEKLKDPNNFLHHQPNAWSQFSKDFENVLRRKYEGIYSKNERLQQKKSRLAPELLTPETPTPDDAYFAGARVQALARAMEKLPKPHQAMMWARAEGETLDGVAAELSEGGIKPKKITRQGVDQAVGRARRRLRYGPLGEELRAHIDFKIDPETSRGR